MGPTNVSTLGDFTTFLNRKSRYRSGAIHLLNGLYDAKMDHQPVLAIVGQSGGDAIGGDFQQEVDIHSLFKDVAHEYVHTAMSAAQVRHLIDRAIRIACVRRTVTCLVFPHDVQELELIVTDGFSCREQIAQCAHRRAYHLAEVLRMGLS